MVHRKIILLQCSYAAIAYRQQRSLKTCGKFVRCGEKKLNKTSNCHVYDALPGWSGLFDGTRGGPNAQITVKIVPIAVFDALFARVPPAVDPLCAAFAGCNPPRCQSLRRGRFPWGPLLITAEVRKSALRWRGCLTITATRRCGLPWRSRGSSLPSTSHVLRRMPHFKTSRLRRKEKSTLPSGRDRTAFRRWLRPAGIAGLSSLSQR